MYADGEAEGKFAGAEVHSNCEITLWRRSLCMMRMLIIPAAAAAAAARTHAGRQQFCVCGARR